MRKRRPNSEDAVRGWSMFLVNFFRFVSADYVWNAHPKSILINKVTTRIEWMDYNYSEINWSIDSLLIWISRQHVEHVEDQIN